VPSFEFPMWVGVCNGCTRHHSPQQQTFAVHHVAVHHNTKRTRLMLVVGPFDTQLRTHDTHGTHHTKRKRKNLPVWREVEHMETLPNFHANAHAINILDIHRSLLHLTMMELMSSTTSSAGISRSPANKVMDLGPVCKASATKVFAS